MLTSCWQEQDTPMHKAALEQHVSCMRALLTAKADLFAIGKVLLPRICMC